MTAIQQKRLEMDITQDQLAKKLGVDRTTVTKWETGKSLPRSDVLRKLAGVLGCTIDDLLCKPGEEVRT